MHEVNNHNISKNADNRELLLISLIVKSFLKSSKLIAPMKRDPLPNLG